MPQKVLSAGSRGGAEPCDLHGIPAPHSGAVRGALISGSLGKASRQLAKLLFAHGWPMLAQHLGEILRQGTDLLLQKKEGCSDGTQLSFVNNKGESRHLYLCVMVRIRRMVARVAAKRRPSSPLTSRRDENRLPSGDE